VLLGAAHKLLDREGGIEEATLYCQKAMDMAKKADNNDNLTKAVLCLSECYVENVSIDEAMDLHKSLCERNWKGEYGP